MAEIVTAAETEFGKKYMLEGLIVSPVGRTPRIRSVWFVATGDAAPRLVTAYPVSEDH